MSRDRRQTRIDLARGIALPVPEERNLIPPSQDLLDHLWARFGERPDTTSIEGAGSGAGYQAVALMYHHEGVEEILRYLDELAQKGNNA